MFRSLPDTQLTTLILAEFEVILSILSILVHHKLFSVLLIFWLLHNVATRKPVQLQCSNLAIQFFFFKSKQYKKKPQNSMVMENI